MEWHRPHPLTLITLGVQAVTQTVVPLILVLGSSDGDSSIFGQYAEFLFFLLPLGLALARWYSTRYALDEEAVYLNTGIFKRTKQVLPRANVQNLSTTAPLLARATGLVELKISDASADGDIRLRLIERAEAERLTALLRRDVKVPIPDPLPHDSAWASNNPTALPPPTLAPPTLHAAGHRPDSPPAVNPTTSRLIRSSIAVSGNGFVPAGLFALWLALLNWVNEGFLGDLLPSQIPSWAWPLLVIFAVTGVGAMATGARVVTIGGFRLWDDPDRLRMKAGLLTERQVTARRDRIQLIKVNRPWLMRRLGMEEVRFSTADVEDPQTAGMTLLNPAADLGDWVELAPRAIGIVELSEAQLQRVSPLAQRRVFIRFALLAIVTLTGFVIAGVIWSGLMIATGFVTATAIGTIGWFFARRRYERLGYAIGESQVLTRVGVLNEQLTLLRKEKVQGVVVSSTFFQRRLNLATLSVGTAGHGGSLGGLRLPDLTSSRAFELANVLATHAAATRLERTL